MKNVIITILAILVLSLGGFLFYRYSDATPIKDDSKEEKGEQYTLIDKNNANVQYLYELVEDGYYYFTGTKINK